MKSKARKPQSRKGENVKGNQQPGQGGSVTAGGGMAVQDLGGVQRVTTGGQGQEGTSGIMPAGSGTATEGSKPPEGYESWDKFREAVDAGTYKPGAAPKAKEGEGEQVEDKSKTTDQNKNAGLPPLSDPAMQAKLAPFNEEFTKTGTLSAESKAKAAKDFGVPVEMIDLYLAGVTASATAAQQPFFAEFGSQEKYGEFQEWAAQNMTDEEKTAFNTALDKAPQAALMMAKTFKSRWEQNGGGGAPRDITKGAGGGESTGDTYGSWAEVTKDMGKPEYAKDPAFRAKVEAKLGRSNPK
jgi:hypothetical protein